METTKITRENIASHLLDYQLTLIDKTRVNMIDDDKWRSHWTINFEQYCQFHDYSISLIKKVFHCNRGKAEHTFSWFFGQFGVTMTNE